MKILVLITNNKEITDNISLSRSDYLGIILLKKKDHVIYYLEEHIRDFIIFDSEEKTANLDALKNSMSSQTKKRLDILIPPISSEFINMPDGGIASSLEKISVIV